MLPPRTDGPLLATGLPNWNGPSMMSLVCLVAEFISVHSLVWASNSSVISLIMSQDKVRKQTFYHSFSGACKSKIQTMPAVSGVRSKAVI